MKANNKSILIMALALIMILLLAILVYQGINSQGEKIPDSIVNPGADEGKGKNNDKDNKIEETSLGKILGQGVSQIKIVTIAGEGLISLNSIKEIETFNKILEGMQIVSDSEYSRDYPYGIEIISGGTTYGLEIDSQRQLLNLGGEIYSFSGQEEFDGFIVYVEDHLLKIYTDKLDSLAKIYLISDDLIKTITIEQRVDELVDLIKSGQIVSISERGRAWDYSVFPGYSLDFSEHVDNEYKIRLVDYDKIILHDSVNMFYLQLDNNLWNIIDKTVNYDRGNLQGLGELYGSNGLDIIAGPDLDLSYPEELLTYQSIRDQVVRELSVSLKNKNSQTTRSDEEWVLQFNFDKEAIKVSIYEDAFVYDGQEYLSKNISKRIKSLLE